jgi:hypothetical protein
MIWIIAIIVAFSGCTGQSKRERQRELLRPVDRQAELRKREQSQSLYDEEGRLRASTDVVAGLRLPRGLTQRLASEHRWTYQTEVPLEKLHWYLSAHLHTTQIQRTSGATTYVAAVPREKPQSEVRIDVTVGPDYPNLKRNIVDISERPPVVYDGKPPMTRFLEQVEYEKRNAY